MWDVCFLGSIIQVIWIEPPGICCKAIFRNYISTVHQKVQVFRPCKLYGARSEHLDLCLTRSAVITTSLIFNLRSIFHQLREDRVSSHELLLSELQQSHASLSLRVADLAECLRSTQEKLSVSTDQSRSALSASAERSLLFARLRAVTALRSASKELARRHSSLCAANTFVQTQITSKPSDCTMQEFTHLVTFLTTNQSISCSVSPSPYYALFPGITRTTRLDSTFPTYKDIRAALKIDVPMRESAVYQNRRAMNRDVRAIQVLSVEMSTSNHRRILLGGNFRAKERSDQAWESAFAFKYEPVPSSKSASPIPATTGSRLTRTTTDLNSTLFDLQFSMTWERIISTTDIGYTADMIPGKLYCTFPAIVLRSRLLTDSTSKIFCTRVNGTFPSHVVSTGHLPF